MYKRSDGLWRDSILVNGKRKYFTGKTQAAVKAKMRAFDPVAAASPSVRWCVDQWQREIEADVSPTTLPGYTRYSSRFASFFGDRPAASLRPVDISRYLDAEIRARDLSRKSAAGTLSVASRVMVWAVAHGYAEFNPCRDIEVPGKLRHDPRELPEDDVLRTIRGMDGSGFSLFFLMAMYTGLRKGELLALTWDDVDLRSRTITVTREVYSVGNRVGVKAPKTEAGARTVMIPDRLFAVMKRGGSGLLFPDPQNGGFLRNHLYRRLFSGVCEEYGFAVTAHQLRHAYASLLEEANVPEKVAQDLLGHAQISTTKDIYTHIRAAKRRRDLEALRSIDFDL